jgi:hypothetical protein
MEVMVTQVESPINVQFSTELLGTLPKPDLAVYAQLIRETFRRHAAIEQVLVSTLPGGHTGLGSLAILLAQPMGRGGVEYVPLIVRVGRPDRIQNELENYRRYVASRTGTNLVQPQGFATAGHLACITYNYLEHVRKRQPLHTLRKFLQPDEDNDRDNGEDVDLDVIIRAVEILFLDTLARGHRKNRWYNDAYPFPDQCPLWFYNQVLPPTVSLENVTIASTPGIYPPLADMLEVADQAGANELHGRWVELTTTTIYPHLRAVEYDEAAERLRLYLLEGTRLETDEYLSLLPVAARIEIKGSPDTLRTLALTNKLDGKILHGQIYTTRYAMLDERFRRFGHLLKPNADGSITYEDIRWKNPLEHYHRLLTQRQSLRTSIIHGDMNLGNILLTRPEEGRSADAIAWLIDFDRTDAGGHTVFDAVKLETEYKIHILPTRLRSVENYILLEKALNQALISPTSPFDFGEHHELHDAYQFIATLRRIVLRELAPGGQNIPPTEYFQGLLGYGIAALKYDNLYTQSAAGNNWNAPQVSPPAAAAYLSAAAAVYAIETYKDSVVQKESFAPAPPIASAQRLIPRPHLFGRQDVLAQAYERLEKGPPVVLLQGALGSGRGDIARAIYAKLQRSNYLVWKEGLTQSFTTVEQLNDELSAFIHSRRFSDPDLMPVSTLGKTRSAGGRKNKLLNMRQHLLEALESGSVRFLLCLRLDRADTELREFVGRLCNRLERSAAIVIAESGLDDLNTSVPIHVSPLSLEAVREYVRHEQLLLDERAIRRLHRVSFGLPTLLTLIIKEATYQQGMSLQEAVLSLQAYKEVDTFAQEVARKRLPEPFWRILELDALLTEYGLARPSHVELLFEQLAPTFGWTTPRQLPTLLARYRQHIGAGDGLAELLRPTALNSLRARVEFQPLCARIAEFYTAEQVPDCLYIAACYHALAGQWNRAAGMLVEISKDPRQRQYIYGAGCQTIYVATKEALQHSQGHHEHVLLELAGDCAAYLGYYEAAAKHYERLIARLPSTNDDFLRLNLQLLKVHEESGDRHQAHSVYQVLKRYNRSNPIAALGLAYQAIALIDTDLSQAEVLLLEAIQAVEQTRDQWGEEQRFYKDQLVRLYDRYALAQAYQGKYDQAIDILTGILQADEESDNKLARSLIAMIQNNLGGWFFYRGRDTDISLARQSFEAAFELRESLGDRVGQMRTAQNLAILMVEQASTLDEWKAAEQQYERFERVARNVESSDRFLILANLMELLIRAGDFAHARTLFTTAMQAPHLAQVTRILLLTNRAKLAIWEGDAESCQEYLAQVLALVDARDDIISQLEWFQLTIESHILFDTAFDSAIVQRLTAADISPEERPLDAASWLLACGLLAFVQNKDQDKDKYNHALELLQRSRALWTMSKYRYLAAIVALWQVHVQFHIGDAQGAQANGRFVEQMLQPFGEVPALKRLRTFQ